MTEELPNDRNKLIKKRDILLQAAQYFVEAKSFDGLPELLAHLSKISWRLGEHLKAEEFTNMSRQFFLRQAMEKEDYSPEPIPEQEISLSFKSIISEKQKKPGTPLDSGIVPIVVKTEKEVLSEILNEKLPYLLEADRQTIVEKVLNEPLVKKRDHILTTFFKKYKEYGIDNYNPVIIKNKLDEVVEWFSTSSEQELKNKIGFFDPLELSYKLTPEEIISFIGRSNIPPASNPIEKIILKYYAKSKFYMKVQSDFKYSQEFQDGFRNPLNYLGYFLFADPILRPYFEKYDFFSQYELIEIFADFCADMEFIVYDLTNNDDYPWDLFLVKKTQAKKSGVTCILRGYEIRDKFDEIVEKLKKASDYCDWAFFVTTPYGVLNIGLNKLIKTLGNIGVGCYIIDPMRCMIYALLKEKDIVKKVKKKEKKIMQQLKSPLRSPNLQIKRSKFEFDQKFQYKSKNFVVFNTNVYPANKVKLDFMDSDKKNLQYLLILLKNKGIRLEFIEWTPDPINPDLLSGFITAIDSFGSNFSESDGLQEIRYKGFTITFVEGNSVKGCLFLKENPSPRLRELLEFGVTRWESHLTDEIENFYGDLTPIVRHHPETVRLFNQLFLGDSCEK